MYTRNTSSSSSNESSSLLSSTGAATGAAFGGNAFAPFWTLIHNIHDQWYDFLNEV